MEPTKPPFIAANRGEFVYWKDLPSGQRLGLLRYLMANRKPISAECLINSGVCDYDLYIEFIEDCEDRISTATKELKVNTDKWYQDFYTNRLNEAQEQLYEDDANIGSRVESAVRLDKFTLSCAGDCGPIDVWASFHALPDGRIVRAEDYKAAVDGIPE